MSQLSILSVRRLLWAILLLIAGVGLLGAYMRWASGSGGMRVGRAFAGRSIELFAGSASKPALEETTQRFEAVTGCRVWLQFGGSGRMLAQMQVTRRGDIYVPGSSDFMEQAKRRGLVRPETERIVAFLIVAINVQKGNPKHIKSIKDLARPGIRIGLARPDVVCVGLYAVETLMKAGLWERVRPNIATYAESCAKTAQLVSLGAVDAIVGWRIFQYWNPTRIETVLLKPDRLPRIGYIPIAVSTFCRDRELADRFISFLCSDSGQAIFRKWGYLTTEREVRRLARADTPIGGEWPLPEEWR